MYNDANGARSKLPMETSFRQISALVVITVCCHWRLLAEVKTLHTFDGSDSAQPMAGLVSSGNTLYGTTDGSVNHTGTVFSINADGTGFKLLHVFNHRQDGDGLDAELTLSGDTLYGTASIGGVGSLNGFGAIFKLKTDGTGFTRLYSFTGNSDGAYPHAGLVLSGTTLYGSASQGAVSNNGTLFAINSDGTGFRVLHTFNGQDGRMPFSTMVLSGDILYGSTQAGGALGDFGTVFKINADGTGFLTLHTFTGGPDGAYPGALTLVGNTLFAGAAGAITPVTGARTSSIFAINTDGSGFTTLHTFTAANTNSSGVYTNSDGTSVITLVFFNNTFYGTTSGGGIPGCGTVFALSTNGTRFTQLHSFTRTDGRLPLCALVLLSDTLYGTTAVGASSNLGSVFSLSLAPRLSIFQSGENIALAWPTNYAGFDYSGYTLQSATNLASQVWVTNLPVPVIVNGQNTVTTPISGAQQFFRLSQ
jgi:uncharacterized repeat protein (TIGR03803 family)